MELARAGARAGVASVGGVREEARAALLHVTGGPGSGAGGPGGNGTRGCGVVQIKIYLMMQSTARVNIKY